MASAREKRCKSRAVLARPCNTKGGLAWQDCCTGTTGCISASSAAETHHPRGSDMWKKEDGPTARDAGEDAPRMTTSRSTGGSSAKATIGPSISIKGDVTGTEDLLIQGRVDGSVTLDHHSVSVGSEGQVKANITGRVITIEGKVDGDLTAEEQIVLLGSAQVHGDIKAPRVVLEDGATFRGLVG